MSFKSDLLEKLIGRTLTNRGFALTEAMIAGAVGLATIYAISEGMVYMNRSSKAVQAKGDWNSTTSIIRQIMSDPFACTRALQGISFTCNPIMDADRCVAWDIVNRADDSLNLWSSAANRTPILTVNSAVSGIRATSIQFLKQATSAQVNGDYSSVCPAGGCTNRTRPSGSTPLWRSDVILRVTAQAQTAPNVFAPLTGLGTNPANTFAISIYFPGAGDTHQSTSGTSNIGANAAEFCTPQGFDLNTLITSYPAPSYPVSSPTPTWSWAPVGSNLCDGARTLSVGCLLANAHLNDLPYTVAAPNLITGGDSGPWRTASGTNDIFYSDGKVSIGTSSSLDSTSQLEVDTSGNRSFGVSRPGSSILRFTNFGGVNYIQSAVSPSPSSAAPLYFTSMYAGNTWMVLDQNGELGIGTTNPSSPLHVVAASASTTPVAFFDGTNIPAGTPIAKFKGRSGNTGLLINSKDSSGIYSQSDSSATEDLSIGVQTGSGAWTEAIHILPSPSATPRVGIGTSAPASLLDVRGTASVNNLTLPSNATICLTQYCPGAYAIYMAGPSSPNNKIWHEGPGQSGGIGNKMHFTVDSQNNTPTFLFEHMTPASATVPVLDMIIQNGRIGIGTDSPTAPLDIPAFVNSTRYVANSSTVEGGAWSWRASNVTYDWSIVTGGAILAKAMFINSDQRMKKDILDLSIDRSLEFVRKSRPVTYTWKEKFGNPNQKQVGLIAQELIKSGFPELVATVQKKDLKQEKDHEGFTSPKGVGFTVSYDKIGPILTNVCKYLLNLVGNHSEIIKELKEENTALKTYLCKKDPDAPFCKKDK